MDELAPSPELEAQWIKNSLKAIHQKYEEYEARYPFDKKRMSYWDADEAGLECFENPIRIETRYGRPVLLTGDPKYHHESELVFHIHHIVSLHFMPKDCLDLHLRKIFEVYDIFPGSEVGHINPVESSNELNQLRLFSSKTSAVIRTEIVGLRSRGLTDSFQKICDYLTLIAYPEMLRKRFEYLKELVIRSRKNKIYRNQIEKLKFL